LSLWTKQLDDVADALALRELALVGFSFGGMIAKAYAAQSNRVSRLAIMSAVHQRSEAEQAGVDGRLVAARRDGPHAIVEAALTRWFSEAFAAANPDAIMSVKQRLLGNDPASFLAAYAAFARGDANDLSRIRCPALVMTGELDAGSTPQMARWMADAIAGAELCIVPGARHMMPVEHEAEIANILRRFLGWRKS
jgi:pimeloyl-ACP methyl ester carboxylesterase